MATSTNYVMRHVLDLEYEEEKPPPQPPDEIKVTTTSYDKLLSDRWDELVGKKTRSVGKTSEINSKTTSSIFAKSMQEIQEEIELINMINTKIRVRLKIQCDGGGQILA